MNEENDEGQALNTGAGTHKTSSQDVSYWKKAVFATMVLVVVFLVLFIVGLSNTELFYTLEQEYEQTEDSNPELSEFGAPDLPPDVIPFLDEEENPPAEDQNDSESDTAKDNNSMKKSKVVQALSWVFTNVSCIPRVCQAPKRFISHSTKLNDKHGFYYVASFPGSGNTWTRAVSE